MALHCSWTNTKILLWPSDPAPLPFCPQGCSEVESGLHGEEKAWAVIPGSATSSQQPSLISPTWSSSLQNIPNPCHHTPGLDRTRSLYNSGCHSHHPSPCSPHNSLLSGSCFCKLIPSQGPYYFLGLDCTHMFMHSLCSHDIQKHLLRVALPIHN